MWRRALVLVALSTSAVALWLVPREAIWHCRLFLYDLWPRRQASALFPRDTVRAEEVASDLRLRLLQKDAEINALRVRLRHIGELREAAPQLRFVSATVIGVGGARWGEIAIVDRGSRDGVAVGDAVAQGQALAGVVRRTGIHSAEVALLWSPCCLVAARLVSETSADGELWAVQGDGRGGVRAVCYSRFTKARQGAMLLTAEAAGAVPPQLLLGTITADPVEGAEPGTMEAPLQPAAELRTLDGMLIVQRASAPPMAATIENSASSPGAAPGQGR